MTEGPAAGSSGTGAVPEESLGDGPASGARATLLADAIGGARGLIDSGLPAVVFVIVNATSGLTPAVFAALGFGVVLVVFRLLRREPIQQAIAGFAGLGIAALVASRTHKAEGFFLPGILYQGVLALAAAVSLAVRRPYIGYVMAALDPRYAHWRTNPKLLRAMDLATVVWGLVFLLRTVVQGLLYLAHHPGWLAFFKIAMGWPLFAGALASSYALARRAAAAGDTPAGDARADGEPEPPATRDEAAPAEVPPGRLAG